MKALSKYPLLLVSVVCIVIVSLFSSHIVPLYDGVGFPDEPYRYINPPATKKNQTLPPSPAEVSVELQNKTNPSDLGLASKEQGPQVNIYIYRLVLVTAQQSTKAIITAEPVKVVVTKTANGVIAGNAYRLSAVSNGGTVSFKPNATYGFIDLRLPQGELGNATMVYRASPSSRWQKINTVRTGSDIYQSSIKGFGDYAMVPGSASSGNKTSSPAFIFTILASILVILVIILAILRSRDKKSKMHK